MPTYRLGLQTITWGDWQVENMPAVIEAAARSGYDGVEVGFRRLAATSPAELAELLQDEGLAGVGIHAGGNLEDRAQASAEHRVLDRVLEYACSVGAPFVLYSGLNAGDDRGALEAEVARINRIAVECACQGLRLLYHNHNWEFADGWRIMETLLAGAATEVGFCPDVGWVYKAGVDPLDYLRRIRGRIGAVHFKDFASTAPVLDTVKLGTGVVPFSRVVRWMEDNEHGNEMWVVAEQDVAEGSVEDVVRSNAIFLREILR